MEQETDGLTDEKLTAALALLAGRLGWTCIPEPVAHDIREAVLIAYGGNEAEYWRDAEADARESRKKHFGGAEVTTPNRWDYEPAPELVVEPEEDTLRRAEAFAEVAATMAAKHPDVRRFRRSYLRGKTLTEDEARVFFERQGGPLSKKPLLKKLFKLAEKLSRIYCWREGDAAWFVLTGHVPPVRPLEVRVYVNPAPKGSGKPRTRIRGSYPARYVAEVPEPAEYHPDTARISVTAHAWVGSGEVERAFRDAQRQVLGEKDAAGRMPERSMEVIRFVSNWIREHGEKFSENWPERSEAWNERRREWAYGGHRTLRKNFMRFFKEHVHRTYEVPKYKLREKTPYEAYYDDWANHDG